MHISNIADFVNLTVPIVDESIVQFGTTSPKNSTPIQEKIGTDTEEKTNIDTVDNASRPALTLRPVRLKYFQSL